MDDMAKTLDTQSAQTPPPRSSKRLKENNKTRASNAPVTPPYSLRSKTRPKPVGPSHRQHLQESGRGNKARRPRKQKIPTGRAGLCSAMKIPQLLNPAPEGSAVPRVQPGIRNRQSSIGDCIEVSQPKEQEVRPASTEGRLTTPRHIAEACALTAAKSRRGRAESNTQARMADWLARNTPRRSELRSRSLVSKQRRASESWGGTERRRPASSSGLTSSWRVSTEDATGSVLEEDGSLRQTPHSSVHGPSQTGSAWPLDACAISTPPSPCEEAIQRQLWMTQYQELAVSGPTRVESTCHDEIRENALSEEQNLTRHLREASLCGSTSSRLSMVPSSMFDDNDIACLQELTPLTEEHVTPSSGTEDAIVMRKTTKKRRQGPPQKGQKRKRGHRGSGTVQEGSPQADGLMNALQTSLSTPLRWTRVRGRLARGQQPPVNDTPITSKAAWPSMDMGPLNIISPRLPPSPLLTPHSSGTGTSLQRPLISRAPSLASPQPPPRLMVQLRLSPSALQELMQRRDQECTMPVTASTPEHAQFATPTEKNRLRRSDRTIKKPDYFQPSTLNSKVAKTGSNRAATRSVAEGTATSQKRRAAPRKASSSHRALAKVTSGGVSKRSRGSPKSRARSAAGRLNTPPESPELEGSEPMSSQPIRSSSPVLESSSSSTTGVGVDSLYGETDVHDNSTQDNLTQGTEHVSTDAVTDVSVMETQVMSLTVTEGGPAILNAPTTPNGEADHDSAAVMDIAVSPQDEHGAPLVKAETSSVFDITIQRAEIMSVPSPGGKLVAVVEIAKSEGLLRNEYDSAAVRRVDGKFLVPKKCDGCVAANEFCDRSDNCQTCVTKGLSCTRDPTSCMVVATPKAKFEFPGLVSPHRNHNAMNVPLMDRPEPVGQPRVWAESRHALCETLPYFRAFQSAAYLHEGICWALLVDRQGSERDVITDNVVITRCGGGMSRVDGEMIQMSDQTGESSVVRSLVRNMELKIPVILIIGQGNPNSPSRIPHRYCVMDYFHITRIWCEKAGAKNCYMFRFEKVFQDVQSWWSPSGQLALAPPAEDPVSATCVFCEKDEVQMYTAGWMCLNEECKAFWTIDLAPPTLPLRHTSHFINHRAGFDWRLNKPPCPLEPQLFKLTRNRTQPVSRLCWKGIVCQRCGRCISRVEWFAWKCQTPRCGFTYTIPFTPLEIGDVANPHGITTRGHAAPTTTYGLHITSTVRFTDNYRINTYTIPGCGTITHIQANLTVNQRPGGPDDMFVDLQQMDLGLKRYPLSNSQLPGALTAHFAVNYGMPYKYIVAVDSKPFSEAPKEVLKALHRLTWAGEQSVTDGTFQKFNELLAVGYLEEQKMGYHDDGERTLGPTIATMSLGAEATMSFRMKKTYWTGYARNGVYKIEEDPLPGCRNYEQRKELHDNFDTLTEARRNELMDEISRGPSGFAQPALKTILRHGDLLVMHGADIQKYYEHTVQYSGKLRFALTCRFIKPDLIPEDQHWKGDYVSDNDYQYDGDDNRMDVDISPSNGWADGWAPHLMSSIDGLPGSGLPVVYAPEVEPSQVPALPQDVQMGGVD